jgi:hypothetical protein
LIRFLIKLRKRIEVAKAELEVKEKGLKLQNRNEETERLLVACYESTAFHLEFGRIEVRASRENPDLANQSGLTEVERVRDSLLHISIANLRI